MPIHEIETSRGKIRIVDDHIFEITVPVHSQLVLSFEGEKTAFLTKDLLDNAKASVYNRPAKTTPPSSS